MHGGDHDQRNGAKTDAATILSALAIKRLRRSCVGIIVFGALLTVLPLTDVRPVILPGIVLAVCAIGMAVFAMRARVASRMLLRTFLAVLLLGLSIAAHILLSKYA